MPASHTKEPLMSSNLLRPSFIVFHLSLGVGLLIGSVQTLAHTIHEGNPATHHVLLIAGIEALGAVLFLVPRTLRAGAVLLLVSITLALLLHAAERQWR